MYCVYGNSGWYIHRGPLFGGGPLLGGSVIGGSTVVISDTWLVVASYPGRLGGEKRPGIHCMRMRENFSKFSVKVYVKYQS